MERKIELVKSAIKALYIIDHELIERDLCERCLVHRLAVHLGNHPHLRTYIVDCEFNRAFNEEENDLKRLSSKKGNYVDIIVHKRSDPIGDNLFCFEVKKASNKNKEMFEKDRVNLQKLTTSPYFYTLGFHINIGKSYKTTRVELYSQGHFVKEVQM